MMSCLVVAAALLAQQSQGVERESWQRVAFGAGAWIDYDLDGDLDLFAAPPAGVAELWRNDAGRLQAASLEAGLAGAADARLAEWGNLNDDRFPDLALVERSGNTRTFLGGPGGVFSESPYALPAALGDALELRCLDYDGDGDDDLFLAGGAGTTVLQNDGAAGFELLGLGAPLEGPVSTGSVRIPESPVRPTRVDLLSGQAAGARPPGTFPMSHLVPACAGSLLDRAMPGSCIQASSTPTLGALFPLSPEFFVSANGDVGLGTTSPNGALNVVGDRVLLEEPGTGHSIQMRTTGSALDLQSAGAPLYVNHTTDEDVYLMGAKVGIGTSSPSAKLEVDGTFRSNGSGGRVDMNSYSGGSVPSATFTYNDAPNSWIIHAGAPQPNGWSDLTIGSRASSSTGSGTVRFVGWGSDTVDLVVDGDVSTRKLTVRGADLAEGLDVAPSARTPGTLLVIDPDGSGALLASSSPYQSNLAGVVSGANGVRPGLCLAQEGVADGETQVALVGQAYVLCATENGAIRPGDPITTSSQAGHGMRATDRERASWAVIGKALTALEDGSGFVLVLINLQ